MRVSTGEAFGAGTWDKMSVIIVGTEGETLPLPLDHFGKEFSAGAVSVGWGWGRRRREQERRCSRILNLPPRRRTSR